MKNEEKGAFPSPPSFKGRRWGNPFSLYFSHQNNQKVTQSVENIIKDVMTSFICFSCNVGARCAAFVPHYFFNVFYLKMSCCKAPQQSIHKCNNAFHFTLLLCMSRMSHCSSCERDATQRKQRPSLLGKADKLIYANRHSELNSRSVYPLIQINLPDHSQTGRSYFLCDQAWSQCEQWLILLAFE